MSKEREALKLALELFEAGHSTVYGTSQAARVITAIREVLAEQPAQQELVDSAEKAGAYMEARLWEFIDMAAAWPEAKPDARTWAHVMAYAPPASKPWVGLTDEDRALCVQATVGSGDAVQLMCAIEAKLREKNAQPSKPLTDEQITAGARALCNRMAEACGVDERDQWQLYADTFKEDAKAVLEAAAKLREKNA